MSLDNKTMVMNIMTWRWIKKDFKKRNFRMTGERWKFNSLTALRILTAFRYAVQKSSDLQFRDFLGSDIMPLLQV
jgi:hypothetical protein